MLTKNFYNCLMSQYASSSISGGIVDYEGGTYAAYCSGTTTKSFYDAMTSLKVLNTYAAGVRIGSGTTPATPSNFCLESVISSGATVTNPNNILVNSEEDGVSVSATYSVLNIGSDDLIISEIGLFDSLMVKLGSSTSYVVSMIDHTVLDEPITIAPSQTKQLTYTIKFNYPTA